MILNLSDAKAFEMALLKYSKNSNDISFNKELFTEDRKKVYEIFIEYFRSYHSVVKDLNTFSSWVKNKEYPPSCLTVFSEVEYAKPYEKDYLIDVLWDYYRVREMQEASNIFNTKVRQGTSIIDAQRQFISHMLNVRNLNDKIKQGYIFDNVKERWIEYMQKEANPIKMEGIPTHFHWWDKNCSGAVKKRLYMIYGPPKSGKSTVKMNVGYNIAVYEHQDVMVVTGEMPKDKLENIFFSREARLDSMLISNGNLSPQSREIFKSALRNIFLRKDLFYVVEPRPGFTTEDLIGYAYGYEKKTGRKIKVMIVDYLRKMDTSRKNTATHEKLDYITEDLFENLAKGEDMAVITSTHENRIGAMARRKGEANGVENIDGSYRIANSVNALFLLDSFKNTKDPKLINKMRVSCEINRDGPSFTEEMIYIPENYYVGDPEIEIPKEDTETLERDFD